MSLFDSILSGLKTAWNGAVKAINRVKAKAKKVVAKTKEIVAAGITKIPASVKMKVKVTAAKALRYALTKLKDKILQAVDAWIQDILYRTTHRIVVEIYNFAKVRVLNSEAVQKTYERLLGRWKRRERNKAPITRTVRNTLYNQAVQETRARASYTVPLTKEEKQKVQHIATNKPVIRKLTVSPDY